MSAAPEEIKFQVFGSLERPAERGGEILLGLTADQKFLLAELKDGRQQAFIGPLTLPQALRIAEGAILGEPRFLQDPTRTAMALGAALLALEGLITRGASKELATP
jgi:hypothetical protein